METTDVEITEEDIEEETEVTTITTLASIQIGEKSQSQYFGNWNNHGCNQNQNTWPSNQHQQNGQQNQQNAQTVETQQNGHIDMT